MATGGPLQYLQFGNVEVANAARTLEYLRAGLGDSKSGRWELGSGQPCSVLYRLNGGNCASPEVFKSPAADPAPWYDPLAYGSAAFLGLVLLDIQGYDSTIQRPITPRVGGLGGGIFAGQRRLPRVWKFRGALVNGSDAGAEYGLRWLTSILESGGCDNCSTYSLRVRLSCPPANCSDDSQGEWTSYDAALVDGPHEVEKYAVGGVPDALIGCRDYVTVEFTVVAANPFLYKREQLCRAATTLGFNNPDCVTHDSFPGGFFLGGTVLSGDTEVAASSAPAICCSVTPPTRGTLAPIFTIKSVSGMGSVLLEAHESCASNNSILDTPPVLQMQLGSIPPNSTVVVDCSQRTITVTTQVGSGPPVVTNGVNMLLLPSGRGLEWIEVRDCDTIQCVCARPADACSGGADTTVSISTQAREG
jgi:hypothetical protein